MPAQKTTSLLKNVISQLRKRANVTTLSDSTGASLTGRQTLLRALVLRRLLRHAIAPDERNVGILLPPTVAAAVTNLALALDRRVAVNLNYSLSQELIRYSVKEAGLRHVIASRAFLERMPIDLGEVEVILLEDLAKEASPIDKGVAALQVFLPLPLLERVLGIDAIPEDDLMTIIFTSGSTGRPKGVMLPWRSIEANKGMVDALLRLRSDDVMLGVLPFFHTFGYTITLWGMLATGVGAVYHTNPLEARVISRLIREHGVTILLGTPTLLRAYMRRLSPEDFAPVEIVATGSERLPQAVADEFESKFGIRPFQGYGATELGPIVSANVPAARALGDPSAVLREGTVGRPAQGVHVEVRDPETGAVLGTGERGVLWVTGPHVMLGYLNQPQLTDAVLQDGWYNTGDIVTIDEDGFISIVGRQSRFAKVGGEQVPFAAIEEVLAALTGGSEDGAPRAVVTAVPDEATGERLVVVHTTLEQSPDELVKGLAEAGLPRLFIPAPVDFHQIDTMPLIGIGKVDLEAINSFARQAAAARQSKRTATR
ncbi:MAG: 1-acyl-sn-glycerol-3-phosphate acyltransferase [Thermomicrobiales bacterium]|jgi:acyl-[acyl-carrier-protein]-phospholipid O-acyltransferase/long-chain-fatty-acid--[acyl-carrier-protein] ligase|nr:1-acyl-sn-glycerol-3-phosphate acyltransferase [Thermomicrobiales bacterium]